METCYGFIRRSLTVHDDEQRSDLVWVELEGGVSRPKDMTCTFDIEIRPKSHNRISKYKYNAFDLSQVSNTNY